MYTADNQNCEFSTHQIIKDISLMDVNGNKGFKLGPLNLGQVARSLINQQVQQFQESLISLRHHLPVILGTGQSLGGVTGPDHLDTQQTDLWKRVDKISYF